MENRNIPYELSDYILRKTFRQTGERQGWLHSPAIIASVSGGGDSIALLWLCSKFYAGRLAAFHVNHGIRGEESDFDEDYTVSFAQSLGVDAMTVRVSVPSMRKRGESLEAAARRVRHEEVCRAARTLGINTILLGHNRDDLAETVLFNLIRGTGIRGSVGMTESTQHEDITFHRPLLGYRREFLREILRVRGITWREDSTNDDMTYTRNYIRKKLLPQIERKINAQAIEHLASFGEMMRSYREREDRLSHSLMSGCVITLEPLALSRAALRKMSDDDITLVMRQVGRNLGLLTLSRARSEELTGLIRGHEEFMFQWCGDTTVTGKSGGIYIWKR